MPWLTVFAISALGLLQPAPAEDFAAVGSFRNVRASSSEDPHCYGWSLELWRYNGKLLGLLDRHYGLCGDPPCEVVSEVSHDPKTGRLSFSAFGSRFVGTLKRNEVAGKLGDESLRLKRSRDDASWLKTLDAWCRFWSGVPRCKGVAEACRSLGGDTHR